MAHVRQPIAEPFMGGMEAHAWHLAAGLEARGHEVTLFAAGDSDPRFRIMPILDEHYERTFPWLEHKGSAVLNAYVDAGFERACAQIDPSRYDVVHNNSLHRFPLQRAKLGRMPTVTSLHVPPFEGLDWFVRTSSAPWHWITVTSAGQRGVWWPDGAPAQGVVAHNGIDLDRWQFRPHGDGSAVWCGRITPNKGPHLAARAAHLAGLSLTLFGAIEEPAYYEAEVAPLLGDTVRYGGHLSGEALAGRIASASVLVFTPCWDEPFGLVAIEAMACGLPVAAFDRGAAREVIAEAGVFAPADDVQALADAMRAAMAIDRRIARRRVERLFSRTRMLEAYESLYEKAISALRPPQPPVVQQVSQSWC